MLKFINKNVNPKNRKTGDCSTRALVSLLNKDYCETLREQTEIALTHFYDVTSRQTMEKFLLKYGWIKMKQPRKADGTKYKVKEMDRATSAVERSFGIIANVANHYTVIKDDSYIDTWDCGNKTVGNYFIKII